MYIYIMKLHQIAVI